MARQVKRLTALTVQRMAKPGYHADGAGLYLQVSPNGSKSWIYRYRRNGKLRDKGLGSLLALSLAEAREAAARCRKMLAEGIDPIQATREKRQAERLEKARTKTFRQCVTAYLEAKAGEWSNEKHADQWRNTLEKYANSVFGDVPVQDVDTPLVHRALDAIWKTKNETATRVRGRIEKVLDWAKVAGLRTGDNPARWKGHLDAMLAKPSQVQKVVSHPALPFAQIGSFMKALRQEESIAAKALEFTILTAGRTGEIIGTRWEEINLDAAVWTIPAERMKMNKEHRVPLPRRAVELLHGLNPAKEGFVFRGARTGRPLSNMAMAELLKRMERTDITVHGFRSTFRDWAAELTPFPNEVVEMALAHRIANAVEAAYRRGDLMEKRRMLMQEWQDYCDRQQPAQVLTMLPLQTHQPLARSA
jgi:integrase